MKRGRPKGIKETKPRNTAARKFAESIKEQGISPLDIMLAVMAERWEQGDHAGALIAADKAAPYVHARLAAETHHVVNDDTQRSPDDIRREIEDLDRRAKAATTPGDVATPVPGELPGMVHREPVPDEPNASETPPAAYH